MGVILPLTLGVLSSACIAFVYKTSSFSMDTSHAMMWGVGQTVIHAFFGSFRLLATLWILSSELRGSEDPKPHCIVLDYLGKKQQWFPHIKI